MPSYPVSEHAACMVDNFLIIHGGNIDPVAYVTRTNKRHHYYQNKTLGNLIMKNLILLSLQKQLVISLSVSIKTAYYLLVAQCKAYMLTHQNCSNPVHVN